MNLGRYSQRAVFTGAMTFLATLSGTAFAAYEIRGQSDLITDVIKIGGVLALGTACISYVVWSLLHHKKSGQVCGGLAGLITGFIIIPLPYFMSAFKTGVVSNIRAGETGYLMSALDALVPAVKSGLLTFQLLTKVSLGALIASVFLGIMIGMFIPAAHGKT